ncbi:MAG TPA: alpha/beta fold hydrolase [Allosphingosinicella sp.]|nr:alpha/beta fold hydrolase [Allosphingosinicella sp.]HYG29393.1 alpha/beta fold hydrolase [Allosphingosinicella sp.]
MWWKLLLVPAILYLTILAVLFFWQTSLLFPAKMVQGPGPLPPGSERLVVETPGGERLHGVMIRARQGGEGRLILGFGGNAWNAEDAAITLADLFPGRDVVAFHFRGYRPSSGSPSAAALLADAPFLFDEVVRRYRPASIVAVGFSIGSGVAARLAAERPLAGAILVTPYDSLAAVAADHYRWLPVRLLFRHEIRAAADLARTRVPVAILAAGRDDLILPPRTEALRRRIANLVYDRTFPDAGHNDIVEHRDFRPAMRDAIAALGL